MINLMIADDHQLVRDGIMLLLNDLPNMKVIAKASSGEEAIKLAKEKRPDVILIDIKMPGIGGIQATYKILLNNPSSKIIALTTCNNRAFISCMLKLGAKGYLSKGASVKQMEHAIRMVYFGEIFLDPEFAQELALKSISEPSSVFDSLSIRELSIMLMIANGIKVSAISEKLYLSPKTINTYRYRIYEKLNLKNDVDLTVFAIKQDLLDKSIS